MLWMYVPSTVLIHFNFIITCEVGEIISPQFYRCRTMAQNLVIFLLHAVYFFPAWLRFNWHITLCNFKLYICWCDVLIYCKMIATIAIPNTSILSHNYHFSFVVRTVKIYSQQHSSTWYRIINTASILKTWGLNMGSMDPRAHTVYCSALLPVSSIQIYQTLIK